MARGRKSSDEFEMPDGRKVGFSLKDRKTKEGIIYRVVFRHPSEDKYAEVSTGRATKADAYSEAAKIILRAYGYNRGKDPKAVTWDEATTELQGLPVAFKTREAWMGAIKAFRDTVGVGKGPNDVTVSQAQSFVRLYSSATYQRTDKPGAKSYTRSPQTTFTHVTKMKGLWSKQFKKLGFVGSENPWEQIDLPELPTLAVRVPSDDDVQAFFNWLETRYPGWALPRLFFETKAVAGCRLLDLCSVRSNQLDIKACSLDIAPQDDKTNQERIIPLPADLAADLGRLKGKTFLFEHYAEEAKVYRDGPHSPDTYTPKLLHGAAQKMLWKFSKTTGIQLRSHDFRKRAITRFTQATGSVDSTREAFNLNPATARKYYVAAQALNGREVLRGMQDVLRPKKK